jgi:hypothetical protein
MTQALVLLGLALIVINSAMIGSVVERRIWSGSLSVRTIVFAAIAVLLSCGLILGIAGK